MHSSERSTGQEKPKDMKLLSVPHTFKVVTDALRRQGAGLAHFVDGRAGPPLLCRGSPRRLGGGPLPVGAGSGIAHLRLGGVA